MLDFLKSQLGFNVMLSLMQLYGRFALPFLMRTNTFTVLSTFLRSRLTQILEDIFKNSPTTENYFNTYAYNLGLKKEHNEYSRLQNTEVGGGSRGWQNDLKIRREIYFKFTEALIQLNSEVC